MGRQRQSSRGYVEDCTCLDISTMRRLGMFSEANTKGPLILDRLGVGLSDWTLLCSLKHDKEGEFWVELFWEVGGVDGEDREFPLDSVEIERLKNPLSGVHYFLKCPASACGRRVRKLFLPPGLQAFRCRRCHDLRYQSSNRNYTNLKDDVWPEMRLSAKERSESGIETAGKQTVTTERA